METTQLMLIAKNKKNQSTMNKCIKALAKYYALNDLRDQADGEGDERAYKRYDRMCAVAFDKHIDYRDQLPKYEQERINNL
jgi:hypothetical protein